MYKQFFFNTYFYKKKILTVLLILELKIFVTNRSLIITLLNAHKDVVVCSI